MTSVTPRLVATDLDGTIVRSDGTVSARTVAAFDRVRRAGALFVFVTGRPPRLMRDIAEAFGHHGLAICSNGALLYDMSRGEVVGENLIQPEELVEAARLLRTVIPGIGLAVEYAEGLTADELYEVGDWDRDVTIRRVGDSELFRHPAPKLIGRHPTLSADELLALAAPVLASIVTPYHANGERLVEAIATGVSKASALRELADRQGISPVGAIAFGDMPNDLPMLSWAGTSYGVANSHARVLELVDHVISSQDDDGVAEVLERLFPEVDLAGADR
ncbi:HAD family hydrolase [Streptosporangium sp. NPDC000396]|uniref:HAD family hydrolase n=1 Tax=Streptosporangium sp. NPDC000396 TaxID=3366185 RepID=UPI0036D10236